MIEPKQQTVYLETYKSVLDEGVLLLGYNGTTVIKQQGYFFTESELEAYTNSKITEAFEKQNPNEAS